LRSDEREREERGERRGRDEVNNERGAAVL
jgi:hypothetical protein